MHQSIIGRKLDDGEKFITLKYYSVCSIKALHHRQQRVHLFAHLRHIRKRGSIRSVSMVMVRPSPLGRQAREVVSSERQKHRPRGHGTAVPVHTCLCTIRRRNGTIGGREACNSKYLGRCASVLQQINAHVILVARRPDAAEFAYI